MFRLLLTHVLLFLLPFAVYALYLLIKRENPLTGQAWQWREIVWLSLAGFMLSVVIFGTLAHKAGTQLSGRGQAPVEDMEL